MQLVDDERAILGDMEDGLNASEGHDRHRLQTGSSMKVRLGQYQASCQALMVALENAGQIEKQAPTLAGLYAFYRQGCTANVTCLLTGRCGR